MLAPRQLYIIPAGTPHRYGASEQQPWSIYWFHLKGSHASELLSLYRLGASPISLSIQLYRQLIDCFNQTCDLLASSAYAASTHAHISQSMRYLLSSIGVNADRTEQINKQATHLAHAIRYMTEHLADTVRLADLARHTGLSRQHLVYLFKRETGVPPIDYYLRMKMQRASQLLDLTDLTVKEVGLAVGLSDPYYFSRLFKQMIGHSPTQYRRIPKG